MGRGRRVRNLQEAGHIDQEPKDARDHNPEQESLERILVVHLMIQTRHGGDLAASDQDGEHGDDGQDVVVVDQVHGHAVDRVQRALDHDSTQGGSDGRGDAKNHARERDVDVGRDAGHEPCKDDSTRGYYES